MKIVKSNRFLKYILFVLLATALIQSFTPDLGNPYLKLNKNGSITYLPDNKGDIIPDFSRVGYHQGDQAIPVLKIVKTISPTDNDCRQIIQDAIDEVSALEPDKNGFRGAILLKKGTYRIAQKLVINTSGVVLRGEGNTADGTKLIATGKGKRSLISIIGKGTNKEIIGTRMAITNNFVPVGAFSFQVKNGKGFMAGDKVIIYRPATINWINDLKMNQIGPRAGTVQWDTSFYHLKFERNVAKVNGNTIFIDNPIVMQMEEKYGGGEIYKYTFEGRIAEVGIENLYIESAYSKDDDEDHAWTAIDFNMAENCWVNKVTSKYFGFGCVEIKGLAKCITVSNSKCLDAKSIISGGRRYSFNISGQLNLVINCESTEARHDYVGNAKSLGPNVFCNSTAKNVHADIGPHQRWAVGTLYDNITTDGIINFQDRGDFGTGHGWAGVTQVLWNCTALKAAVQSPWVSGKNYCIGLKGKKYPGRYTDRPDGEWYGNNSETFPASLYIAQLKARKNEKK